MNTPFVLYIILYLLGSQLVLGQIKIGGNPEVIHPSSILELESRTQVLVISNLSHEEMQNITPLNGALVFNRDKNCIYFFHQRWIPLCEYTAPTLPPPASFTQFSNSSFLFTHSNGMETWLHLPVQKEVVAGAMLNGYESIKVTQDSTVVAIEVAAVHGSLLRKGSVLPLALSPGKNNQVLFTGPNQIVTWTDLDKLLAHEHNFEEFLNHEHAPTETPANTASPTTINASLNATDSLNLEVLRKSMPGALWYSGENGLVKEILNRSESDPDVFWDAKNHRLGIGTTKPSNKLHIAGEVRSQGYSNSNGTANEPSYSFKSDTNTGIYRAAADQLAFSTKGHEAMRITKSGHLAVGKTTANARLDVYGSLALKINHFKVAKATLTSEELSVILHPEVVEIILPLPKQENRGRIYILKNLSGKELPVNTPYLDKADASLLLYTVPKGLVWLQSDGDIWQQIL